MTSHFKRWVERRAKRQDQHLLTQKNIYIFPSWQGGIYTLMLGLMLVTAINYQSSLIYLLVFLLGSLFVLSIWLCFFNMQGMRLRLKNLVPVEVGKHAIVELEASLEGKERSGFYALLDTTDEDVAWPVEEERSINLSIVGHTRGVHSLPPIRVSTFFPFGLIRAWTWLWFSHPLIVYPTPIKPPEIESLGQDESLEGSLIKGEDYNEIKHYENGESLRRLLWRHYAKRDELLVRTPELLNGSSVELDWESYEKYGVELALSYMAYDVLNLYECNSDFSLELPGCHVEQGLGEAHRDACLRALAEYRA